MFNIGPFEFLVLVIVGVLVVGPDRLPSLARDAARMIRSLREMATGAREQLRDELGPEFADLDLSELRNLNPRAVVQRAVFGEDVDLGRFDPRRLDVRGALFGEDAPAADPPGASARTPMVPTAGLGVAGSALDDPAARDGAGSRPAPARRRPRPGPRPEPGTPYDVDAT